MNYEAIRLYKVGEDDKRIGINWNPADGLPIHNLAINGTVSIKQTGNPKILFLKPNKTDAGEIFFHLEEDENQNLISKYFVIKIGNDNYTLPIFQGISSYNYGIWTTKDLLFPLSIDKGGTGAATVAAARNNLGLGNTSGALPIANGGTGATTASAAITNLGGPYLPLTGGTISGALTVNGNLAGVSIRTKASGPTSSAANTWFGFYDYDDVTTASITVNQTTHRMSFGMVVDNNTHREWYRLPLPTLGSINADVYYNILTTKTFDIKTKSQTAILSGGTTSVTVTADVDNGYSFLVWLQPASSGWVTAYPLYFAAPKNATSTIYINTSPSTNNRNINCTFLEIRI